jgi:hypothetical protein
MSGERAITIVILAMGGEGGGVLADWLVDLAEQNGYFAQTTSVPGVAPAHRRHGVLPRNDRRVGGSGGPLSGHGAEPGAG